MARPPYRCIKCRGTGKFTKPIYDSNGYLIDFEEYFCDFCDCRTHS